jgi:hypothetical protein
MTKVASLDPAKLLTLYFRIARAGSIKFIFTDDAGDPFDITAIEFELRLKRWKDGADVVTLTLADNLNIGGAGDNELTADFDEIMTLLDPATYYWQLYNVTSKQTWLNGDAPFHNGKFDAPDVVEHEITVSTAAAEITITMSAGGSSSSGVEHWRGVWDASTGQFPTGGSGPGGAIQAGDEWVFDPGGNLNGEDWPDGTIAKSTGVGTWRLI